MSLDKYMLGKNKIKKEKTIEMKSMQLVSFKDIEAKRPRWIKEDKITEKEIINLTDDWLKRNEYKGPLSFYKFITELTVTPPLQTPPVTPRLQTIDENTELSDIF